MTAISDPDPSPFSGARAFARLDTRPSRQAAPPTSVEPTGASVVEGGDTVTLNKIGTFLELDLGRLFTWLRAGLFVALALSVIGALGGGAYGILGKPMFTVSSDILINPAKLQVVPNDIYADPSQVDGQILNARSDLRVLTSRNVLARVVDDLKLTSDKEFYDPNPGFSLTRLFGAASTTPDDPKLTALGNLAAKVRTQGDDKSYVATLLVTAESSQKAIAISQAVFQAFRDELAKAEADGASRTAAALADRLNQLKADVQAAEEKVEAYKRAHNLVSTDNGSLVTTQTMTQLNTQVVDAQAKVVAAQSAYDALIAAGRNATTQDTETSNALTALRTNAGGLQQQLDSQSLVLGPKHPTILKLKAELAAVNTQLDTEVARIVSTAKATLDQAEASLAVLTTRSNGLQSGVLADNDALVTLRQLERDATSKSTVYEGFLARARQIAEQEQIDTSNVRVISPAVPPEQRSWPPRTVLLVIGGALAGFALGMLFAMMRGIWIDLRRSRRQGDLARL
jgi:uncharacterized protein involved in exopolysaccharide biosynthesis